jgi:hypothetical protein
LRAGADADDLRSGSAARNHPSPDDHAHDLRSGPAADCLALTDYDAGVNVNADDL